MNIRAITIGLKIKTLKDNGLGRKINSFIKDADAAFAKDSVSIRTKRLNLEPLNKALDMNDQQKVFQYLDKMADLCEDTDIRWFNVPFDLVSLREEEMEPLFNIAYHILVRYPKTFVNFIVSDGNRINSKAVERVALYIKEASMLNSDGYNNFRVGVSCNPKPNAPFFPYTYSSEEFCFSVGLETPKLFNSIVEKNRQKTLDEIRDDIVKTSVPMIRKIDETAKAIAEKHSIVYSGIDASLAPYPEKGSSVAMLIESLGLRRIGSNGTLFLTSFLTDTIREIIDKSSIKSTGFNGVMYSLLEDEFMGKGNDLKLFSIDSLISYSAVCGCGIDMVPLPGDTFHEEIASIILDVAGLSTVLHKPLGVRVLPIPMKDANEFTEFDMDFLHNTRIKGVKNISDRIRFKDSFSYLKLIR